MDIRIVNLFDAIPGYLDALLRAPDEADALWEAHVVAPHWAALCCYAPFPLDDRKPAPCRDADALERQLTAFSALDLPALQGEFARIADTLPNYDDDPITVALCPHPAGDADFAQRQNGVVGTSLFGNLLLCVDPLAPGWQDWLPYVFAHEYHHTVWGNYWYNLHGGALTGEFIEALVIDGLADDFVMGPVPRAAPPVGEPAGGRRAPRRNLRAAAALHGRGLPALHVRRRLHGPALVRRLRSRRRAGAPHACRPSVPLAPRASGDPAAAVPPRLISTAFPQKRKAVAPFSVCIH